MNKLYNDIIKTIPSPDLREYLKRHDFRFTESELIKIIYSCSREYDETISLLRRAETEFNGKRERAHAKKLADNLKRKFDAFMLADSDHVYETEIKCNPDDIEDTYINKTFDDAVQTLKMFIKCYSDVGLKDGENSRYTITKKTTTRAMRPSDIYRERVGAVGQCILGRRFKILYVDMYAYGNEKPCRHGTWCCDECKDPCAHGIFPAYPHFLEKYDLVGYHMSADPRPCSASYGILANDMTERNYDSYVIDLDNKYIKERNAAYRDENRYYRVFDAHEHPDYCYIFKPDPATLPDGVYDDYIYAREEIKKIDEAIAREE